MSNNRPRHPAIVPGVEGILLGFRELFLEEGFRAGNGGKFSLALGLGIGQLLGRHPGLIGPRAVADSHIADLLFSMFGHVAQACKLVKSPVVQIDRKMVTGQ